MPTGLFKTELQGDTFWARTKCLFADRRDILDPDGQTVGSFKLMTFSGDGSRLWDLIVQGRTIGFPSRYVTIGDFPFTIDISEGDQKLATIHSGSSNTDNYSLEFQDSKYLWADASKVKRVMELKLGEDVYARAHSEGLLVNHTFVKVDRELPLEIICLLFCMFAGIVRSRSA